MVDLNERDKEVLDILTDGRANPMLIREKTEMNKGDVNSVLVKLTRDGFAKRVVQGLYEITEKGSETLPRQREAPPARDHYTYEEDHWNTVHGEKVDRVFATNIADTQHEEHVRIDIDSIGFKGASLHGVGANIQASFYLPKEQAIELHDHLDGALDELKKSDNNE